MSNVPPTGLDNGLTMGCDIGAGKIYMQMGSLSRPWTLTTGPVDWKGAAPVFAISGYGQEPSRSCEFSATNGTLSINVTEAAGNVSSAPDYVTSDYVRRLTLHAESTVMNSACGELSLAVDLDAEQVASDLTRYPDRMCPNYCE